MKVSEPVSAEQFANEQRSIALTGIKRGPQSPEHIAKVHTPESIAKGVASRKKTYQEHPERWKNSPETIVKRVVSTKKTYQEHPERWKNSPESIVRQKASYKKTRQEHPERWQNCHSPEANAKRSTALKGRKTGPPSLETRAKISRSYSRGILEGRIKLNLRGISGDFWSEKNQKDIHYRSQLELHWYELLEKMEKVERYEVEPLTIPYQWNGSIHHYLPDLMVFYTDGSAELIEIKPESEWEKEKNQAKWTAAREFCESYRRQVVFKVVGYEGLKVFQ